MECSTVTPPAPAFTRHTQKLSSNHNPRFSQVATTHVYCSCGNCFIQNEKQALHLVRIQSHPKNGSTIWNLFGFQRPDILQTNVQCNVCCKKLQNHQPFPSLETETHSGLVGMCETNHCWFFQLPNSSKRLLKDKHCRILFILFASFRYDKKRLRWKKLTSAVTHYIATCLIPIYIVKKPQLTPNIICH